MNYRSFFSNDGKRIETQNKYFYKEVGHQCRLEQGIDSYWNNLGPEELKKCVVVHPELNNSRIIHQQGLFLLCGFDEEQKSFFSLPKDSYSSFFISPINNKRIYYYFSSRVLSSVQLELDSFGINRSQVYFDLEKSIEYERERALDG